MGGPFPCGASISLSAIDLRHGFPYALSSAGSPLGSSLTDLCKGHLTMKFLKSLLLFTLALCLGVEPALATVVVTGPGTAYTPNIFLVGANNLTSAYTNATTTATDLTGTPIVVSATRKRYDLQYFQICWSADVTKSTSTTGAIGVYVNGALDAGSTRYITSAAGRGQIGGCYVVARNNAATQTISLQGVSADSASFAVTTASIQVWVIQLGG